MRIFRKTKTGFNTKDHDVIKESGLFDAQWYRSTYPDIGDYDPIEHYLHHGASEGRQPSGSFDGKLYLSENGDVRALGFNPLLHWILHGKSEGRRYPDVGSDLTQHSTAQSSACVDRREAAMEARMLEDLQRKKILCSGLFDEVWYRATHGDIGEYDPVLHYIRHGFAEGRAVSPHFDSDVYLNQNPDVREAKINPLLHWIENGHREKRTFPTPIRANEQNYSIYKYCNPDIFENPKSSYAENFKISVVTPSYNTNPLYLEELYNCLRNQTYGNWEWIICDDCSVNTETIAKIKILHSSDDRIKIRLLKISHGIAGATNAGLSIAAGGYIALIDHDDLISRDVFENIWKLWTKNGNDCDLFYTDECKISVDREIYDFFHKPSWSPTLLENTMYVGHLSVYRKDLVLAEGGMRSEYDGTQDYDLALRLSRKMRKVIHVPKIGYLWRAIPGSTAMSLSEKSYAVQKQEEAVTSFATNFAPGAKVRSGPSAGYWRIDYKVAAPAPLLSIIIPTGAGGRMVRGQFCELLTHCIGSLIDKNFYPNMEFVVIHNGNLSPAQRCFLDRIPNVKLVHYSERHLNLSRKMNMGVEAASGEYVCLLNDDIEVITEAAGDALVGFLQAHPKVGAIGPLCLYEDGKVQHNGILMLDQGPSHSGIFKEPEFGGPFNYLRMRREVFGTTGAILITRRQNYFEVGGFDEDLPLNYNDVEFCAKLRASGFSSVVDPEIRVYHFESATKIGTFKCEKEKLFRLLPEVDDPYFNPHYDQRNPYYEISTRKNVYPADSIEFERSLDLHIRSRKKYLQSKNLKFSLAVSVYNQSQTLLNEMFSSATCQTYNNIEIVILDNGSENAETLSWLESIKGHPHVTLIRHEENQGIMGGQRTLLEKATGDYFLPLDSDDFITADCVEIMADAALRNPDVHIFYSDEFKSDIQSNKFSPFYKTDFDHLKIMNCCYVGHQMMFRTEYLRSIGGYSDDRSTWCHDWDSTLRGMEHGATIMHVPELLYAWRINPGSTASVETGKKPEAVASQRFVLERYLKSRGLDQTLIIEENELGPNTGMWTLRAKKTLPHIATISANKLWLLSPSECASVLRAACDDKEYVLLLLEGTERYKAELELSVPVHLDSSVKLVGSALLNDKGEIVWAGGLLDDEKNIIEPSSGMDPRQGGYHGQLYCQRFVDVVAGGNVLIGADILREALDASGEEIHAERLMVLLSLIARRRGWLIATTPHLEAVLPQEMKPIIPLDRECFLRDQGLAGRGPWSGSPPLSVSRTS